MPGGGGPCGQLGGPQPGAPGPQRLPQRPAPERTALPQRKRHGFHGGDDSPGQVQRGAGDHPGRRDLHAESAHGGVPHHAHAGSGGGRCLRHKALLLPWPVGGGFLDSLPRGQSRGVGRADKQGAAGRNHRPGRGERLPGRVRPGALEQPGERKRRAVLQHPDR